MKIRYFLVTITIVFVMLLINYLVSNNTYTINISNKLAENPNEKVLEKYGYISGYNCKKISVVDENGQLEGIYNLEDYVAGVVSGETHILDDEVTFEAMSVAIRTYALYVTNNCKRSITNSEANQVMNNPSIVSKKIKRAVAKTKGQILTLNGKLVKAEYDSFYMGSGFYCDKEFCYANYYKAGNSKTKPKTHKVKVPASWIGDFSGGHGNGLSQYGAKYLSTQGYNYEQILKYFYADGTKISTTIKPNIDGLYMQENFVTRTTRPLRNNKFYYVNNEVPLNTLEGESTWYATSRANEILKSIDSNKKISYFDDSNKYCNLVNFTKVEDYTKPKEGAIISWGKHLAVIERVYGDSVDITEAYPGVGYYGIEYAYEFLNKDGKYYNLVTNKNDRKFNCEENNSGCFKRTNNIKISDLNKRWGYDFKCYIYLIN